MRLAHRACVWLAVIVATAPAARAAPVFNVVYTFLGFSQQPHDLAYPFCDLTADAQGVLYGTAEAGGQGGGGGVFRISPPVNGQTLWNEALLYSFDGLHHTSNPLGGVTLDAAGNIFGTTARNRKISTGEVYKLDSAKGYAFKRLHKFDALDAMAGLDPEASLTLGPGGVLYGTTMAGGANGKGVIFSLSTRADANDYTIITSFPGGRPTGGYPNDGALSLTPQGDLLASTSDLPINDIVRHDKSPGHVFLLSQSGGAWQQRTLTSFPKRKGFYFPTYNVTQAPDGRLYGCAKGGEFGRGGVFALLPEKNGEGATQIPVYDFTTAASQPSNAGNTICALTSDTAGNLFGVTSGGGQYGTGVFFKLTRGAGRTGWSETTLYEFGMNDLPYGVPLRVGGSFYGVSATGGSDDVGYVYQITP